jgi:hypothetical protein
MVYLYLLLARWGVSPGAQAVALLAFASGYLGLGYATTLNNHTLAATALTAAFYHTCRARGDPGAGIGHWAAAGFWAGLAPTLELWAALFCVSFTLLLARREPRRTLLVFIPASLPWLALHLALTCVTLGSVIPAYLRPELHRFPGAYWMNPTGIDAVREPKHVYLFHMLLGHHGFLAMTPAFFLSLAGAWWRARRSREGAWDALAVLVPLAGCIALLTVRTRNYGGMCMGMRWLLFCMPLLFLFVGDWFHHVRRRAWKAVGLVLILVGSLHVAGILCGPYRCWNISPWHAWFRDRGWGSFPDTPAQGDQTHVESGP